MGLRNKIINYLRSYLVSERERVITPSRETEAGLPGIYTQQQFLECSFCKEKILVEVCLFGVSHNAGFGVFHKKCLKINGIDPKFVNDYPKDAARVQKWLDAE